MGAYSILAGVNDTRYCAISKNPSAMVNTARPTNGKSMDASYPEPLDFKMSALVHPTGLLVADSILNALDFLMVSAALKVLLETHATAKIEFLPFRLVNHKGRVAAKECFIAQLAASAWCSWSP